MLWQPRGAIPTKVDVVFPWKDDNPTTRTPVVTLLLIALNVLVYFLVQPIDVAAGTDFIFETAAIPEEIISGEPLTEVEFCSIVTPEGIAAMGVVDDVCTNPSAAENAFPGKNVWLAAVYSMFLHGGILHLGGNMLFLWVFGNNIEDHLGPVRYLIFYLLAGIIATAAHVLGDVGSIIPVVGASGAVAGVMGAYAVWFPWARIRTLIVIFPVSLKAWIVLLFWFGSQFFISPNSGVAYLAHVGGFVFGAAVAVVARGSNGFRDRLWQHKYRTLNPDMPWDPRFGGREDLQDGATPSWHPDLVLQDGPPPPPPR